MKKLIMTGLARRSRSCICPVAMANDYKAGYGQNSGSFASGRIKDSVITAEGEVKAGRQAHVDV